MGDTTVERRKDSLVIYRLSEVENDVQNLRTNQLHSALVEVYHQTNDQSEFSNAQYWGDQILSCRVQINFNDWVYQNFYWEITAKLGTGGSGPTLSRVCHYHLYDYQNNTEFVGSHLSTTQVNPDIIRSGLLTKPATTGTYRFQEEIGIQWIGGDTSTVNAYANIYLGTLVIRYEGA